MSSLDGTRRIPGRVFVPFFLAALALAIAASMIWANKLRPMRLQAYEKTFPLQITLGAACRSPSSATPVDLRVAGRCPPNGALELTARDPGSHAKFVSWAIVDQTAGKPAVGRFVPGETGTAPLSGLTPGTHVLVFVVSDIQGDANELLYAIGTAPHPEIPDRLVSIQQYATVLRQRNADVRTERIEFRIE